MHVRELRPGLWHWQARHPDWEPSEPWDPNVSSYAIDDGERLLLFDPLAVPSEIEALAAERETSIVLTAPWHERDSKHLVERLGVPVYTPLPVVDRVGRHVLAPGLARPPVRVRCLPVPQTRTQLAHGRMLLKSGAAA